VLNQRKTLSRQRKSPEKCVTVGNIRRWRCARLRLFRKTTIAGEIPSESCVAAELRQKSFFVFDLRAAFTAQIDVQPCPFFYSFPFLTKPKPKLLGLGLGARGQTVSVPRQVKRIEGCGGGARHQTISALGRGRSIERREPQVPSER
jgi:hypothetical protein